MQKVDIAFTTFAVLLPRYINLKCYFPIIYISFTLVIFFMSLCDNQPALVHVFKTLVKSNLRQPVEKETVFVKALFQHH